MEQLSLPAGVPIYKDHEYKLVTNYLNPQSEAIDAMSILYLYGLDKTFQQAMGPKSVASAH